MGRKPSGDKGGLKRGAWCAEEDKVLADYIKIHGEGNWRHVAKETGLKRGGKSCRLRWLNYLRPDVKRGNISPEEEDLIIRMHKLLGNRWSLIAGRLPGRTDNEIKNFWNINLSKRIPEDARRRGIRIKANGPEDERDNCSNTSKDDHEQSSAVKYSNPILSSFSDNCYNVAHMIPLHDDDDDRMVDKINNIADATLPLSVGKEHENSSS